MSATPPTTTTTWSVEELRRHARRLDSVADSLEGTSKKASAAAIGNGAAFGQLFGWIVEPALEMVCGKMDGFTSTLARAIDASAGSVNTAADAYAKTEAGHVDSTKKLQAGIATGKSN